MIGRVGLGHRTGRLAVLIAAISLVGCAGATPVPASAPPAPSASAGPASPSASVLPAPSGSSEPTETPWPVMGDAFAILGASPKPYDGRITCSGPIGEHDPVAIITQSSGEFETSALMDYVDPANPRLVCTLDVLRGEIIDAHHLLVAHAFDGYLYAIVDVPEVRFHWFSLPTPPADWYAEPLAVAPGLDEIAWNEVHYGGPYDRIHLATAGHDVVIAKLPDTNWGRCGSPTDSNRAGYTRSGSALFVLDEPLPEVSLIVVKHGHIALSMVGTAKAPISSRPLKVLWSPTSEALYWTQGGDVWRWTAATGRQVFLENVTWSSATISPDGTHLAYDVIDGVEPATEELPATTLHDVYVVDLEHGGKPVRLGGGHAGMPVFLSDDQLWIARDTYAAGCGEGTLQPHIHDIATGVEAPTDIDRVDRVWPATATNN